MSNTEQSIVDAYSELLDSLSEASKRKLIEKLSSSLKGQEPDKEADFYKAFGAFGSEKSAEAIIAEIKSARSFLNKEIHF